jgi:hypothetical protein
MDVKYMFIEGHFITTEPYQIDMNPYGHPMLLTYSK